MSRTVIEGEAYRAPSGQWAWRITEDGVSVCGAGGYESEDAAHLDMLDSFSAVAADPLAKESSR